MKNNNLEKSICPVNIFRRLTILSIVVLTFVVKVNVVFGDSTCPSDYTLSDNHCIKTVYYNKGYRYDSGNSCKLYVGLDCPSCGNNSEALTYCNGQAAQYTGSHTCTCSYISEDHQWECWFNDVIQNCVTTPTSTFTPACYICDHEYGWATVQPGSGCQLKSGVSQANCSGCETGYHYNDEDQCVKDTTTTTEPAHTITFMQAQGYATLVQCRTGNDGKISSIIGKYECDYNPATNCVDAITFWCSQWATANNSDVANASAFATKTFNSDMTYYCVTNSSSHEPTNCSGSPGTPEEPTEPTEPDPEKKCYKCMSGTIPKYVYAYSDSGAATATGGTNCVEVANSKCTQSKKCCYECTKNGSKVYDYNENPDAAAVKTGGSNCSCASSDSYCSQSEVPVNPPTGTTAVIIAWIVGVIAIGYSVWYFIKLQAIK